MIPDLLSLRLHNQKLARAKLETAPEIVAWLGAVQSQEYPAAKWGVSLRSNGLDDAAIDRAFDAGTILRTHVMRPTWHFVTPADIRWMLALTAPRVNVACGSYYRKQGLDARTFSRSRAVFERALEGGKQLTRSELADAVKRARMNVSRLQLIFLVMRAELDAVICSGARRGKEFTYALVDERVPRTRDWTRDEALAELTRRYFTSHGPATIRDYVWWSGLTTGEAKTGIELCGPALRREVVDGVVYFFRPKPEATKIAPEATRIGAEARSHLLPIYDEYLIAYKDREAVVGASRALPPGSRNDPFVNSLVIDGKLAGSWRRTAGSTNIEVAPYRRLNRKEAEGVSAAAERYSRFAGAPVKVQIAAPQKA